MRRTASPEGGAEARPAKPQEKNKGGRPLSLLPDTETLKTVEALGRIQCTTREAAAVLLVCHDTFLKFIAQHEGAADAFERGKQNGKASLRRMQFKAAENGNSTMLVWLGKQWLDQTDKSEVSGKDGAPLVVPVINVSTTSGP